MGVAGKAFAHVSLTAEQRTQVETLFKAAEARHTKAWTDSSAARIDVLNTLADQVQSGAFDRNAIAPKVEVAAAPWRAAQEQDRAAIVELHKALTPEQRADFVEGFESEHPSHHFFGGKSKEDASGKREHFMKIASDLDLTSDQKDKLKEAFHAQGGVEHPIRDAVLHRHDEGKKALEAFKTDSFDGSGVFGAGHADKRIEKMLHFAEIAIPILTPEQRTKAAALLRERAKDVNAHPNTLLIP